MIYNIYQIILYNLKISKQVWYDIRYESSKLTIPVSSTFIQVYNIKYYFPPNGAGRGWAGLGWVGLGRAGLGGAGRHWAGLGGAGRGRALQDGAGRGLAGRGLAGRGGTGLDGTLPCGAGRGLVGIQNQRTWWRTSTNAQNDKCWQL